MLYFSDNRASNSKTNHAEVRSHRNKHRDRRKKKDKNREVIDRLLDNDAQNDVTTASLRDAPALDEDDWRRMEEERWRRLEMLRTAQSDASTSSSYHPNELPNSDQVCPI